VMTGVFSAGQMPQVAPFQSHSTEPAPSQEPGLQPPSATGEAVREPASDGRKAAIRRFVPVPVSIGTAKANASLDSEGVILIVDGGEVARELRDRVEARGYRCALVDSATTATNGHGA